MMEGIPLRMKRPNAKTAAFCSALLVMLVVCYFWLAWGVFADREFGTFYLFPKYRLSRHFFFYSPLGESDAQSSSLSPQDRRKESEFHEFVDVNGGYDHRIH
jgi:hypothetical protein